MPIVNPDSRRRFLAAASAGAAALAAPLVRAQTAKYPSRQIRIVVPFPPGGLTDAYARMYGEQLTQQLGATVLVENKTGAGGVIGIDAVAKAPPDGYTLLVSTTGTVMQNRVLYSRLPYNLDKDLVPIAVFPSGPLVVAVAPQVPARNVKEFLAWAKGREASMGSYAPGSYPHMIADLFNRRYGTRLQAVHYRGESPMWVDLASGQVQVAVGSIQAFNTVSQRGVKPIGVTGTYRTPKLPDVPTLVEQGIDDPLVALEGGLALMAPAGTPEAVLQTLSQVVVKGAETPQAAKLRENFGIPNKPKNLAETRAEWERAVPAWIKAAVDLGIKLD
ncbi:MAG TPA: tripartite tricarboxylate transporter substrate binding protein [Rubrivivax sp.]|nr:tripartite tricarboxylate transporter substrate binding protein [Rubrivivax sp.]HRZ59460.1 tripartite tricarboxylate transporter substrate binding protein [Rubrivivax sp.]